MEIWKPVLDWEGFYEVSSLGSVRSLDRDVYAKPSRYREEMIKRHKGKTLAPSFDTFGYPMVKLKCAAEERIQLVRVHTLVANAFIGPRQEGAVVAHNDGNPKNPAFTNLRYDTMKGNSADRVRHGTYTCGERHSRARLSQKQVEEIRSIQSMPQSAIARKYGITQAHVSALRTGRRWKVAA